MDGIKAGSLLISRAVELEKEEHYSEALTLYQEGLQTCLEYIKGKPSPVSVH